MNHEELIPKILKKTSPLAWRISYEVANSIVLPEDAYQEMQIEQIKIIRKIDDDTKTFDDLVCICLSRLKLYRLYSFRENIRVKDKASSSSDVFELQDYIASPFVHPVHAVEEADLMSRLNCHLELADKKYEGIKEFFEQAINPSEEIWNKVEEYKNNSSCPRGLASGDKIPPSVLAKVMGISPRRLVTYKLIIGKAMVRSGINRALVNDFFDFGNSTELSGVW